MSGQDYACWQNIFNVKVRAYFNVRPGLCFSMSSWGHISMSGQDYAWNNFQCQAGGILQCQAGIMHTGKIIGEFSMSSWGHISMSGQDYACWRNNFQIMQILRVLCEPQFIRSIVVHPSIVVKCEIFSQCFERERKKQLNNLWRWF